MLGGVCEQNGGTAPIVRMCAYPTDLGLEFVNFGEHTTCVRRQAWGNSASLEPLPHWLIELYFSRTAPTTIIADTACRGETGQIWPSAWLPFSQEE